MMKTAVCAAAVAIASMAMLLASHAPPKAEAASIFVFSPANDGFGSFRWAIDQANNNSTINLIVLKNSIPVTLYDTVEYTGSQNLTIQGDRPLAYRVIQGFGGQMATTAEYECALFESTGGADITFYQVTFQNAWCDAIDVYAESGDGEVVVTLNKTIIQNTYEHGLYMSEGDGGGASFKLVMTDSRVEDTGSYSGNGVRVEEYGDGGITANISRSAINRSCGDGLWLDESGAGDISLTVSDSQFNNNGCNIESVGASTSGDDGAATDDDEVTVTDHTTGDGLEADESGEGKLTATFSNVQANGNADNGVFLEEHDNGNLSVTATGLTANENESDGIDVDENDDGDVVAKLTTVQTWYNGDDGVDVDDEGNGNTSFQASNSSSNLNGSDGYEIEEYDNGDLSATFNTVVANSNDDDGLDLEEWGDGSFTASVLNSTITFNGDEAIEADADGDTGTLIVSGGTIFGGFDLDNVNLV